MKVFYPGNYLLLFFVIIVQSCSSTKKAVPAAPVPVKSADSASFIRLEEDRFFEDLFSKNPSQFSGILRQRKKLNIQVIYTAVNRSANGQVNLSHHYFNQANSSYFYPASAIKLPVAILSLQRFNELKSKGISEFSTMLTASAYPGQTEVYNDPNTADGKPSAAQYIKRLFLVSDNDAFNRLYEFLGQEYINAELHKRGYAETQVLHRLNVFLSADENRHTNPVNFYDSAGALLYNQPVQFNRKQYEKRSDFLGKAWYSNGQLKNQPMDFSGKNRIGLQSLHQILISLVMPEAVPAARRFNISDEQRNFLLQYMSAYPRESRFPSYDSSYYDAFVKFLLLGAEKTPLSKNIRIFNKVGNAYGQLVDVAYIIDFDKKIEFFLSAAINCNTDGVLNDDKYDYYNLGFPFMKNLGKLFYDYELKRKKNFLPDLSQYRFNY